MVILYFYPYFPSKAGFFYIILLFRINETAVDERMFIGLIFSLLNWEWHIIMLHLNEFVFKLKITTPQIIFVLF
jgi:membrane protein CcdC involved in cytochrome C biogenesis